MPIGIDETAVVRPELPPKVTGAKSESIPVAVGPISAPTVSS